MLSKSVLYALLAALLFGASTPLAKILTDQLHPVMLAGLLYLGSGIGLTLARVYRDRGIKPSGLARGDWVWFLGAVAFGGILAPVALTFGLLKVSGATASLLLNLEAVLTAGIAWVIFRENADRRIVLGMVAIVAGGVVLSVSGANSTSVSWTGPVLVALACLFWAIDNNFTRNVSASDALFIAGTKGLIAGTVNTGLALVVGADLPSVDTAMVTLIVGLFGYGVSLVCFVLALRGLGTSRTGAYFSTAPFIGAVLALTMTDESVEAGFWVASALMAVGVWLHLTERHEHDHIHSPLAHSHSHVHDSHHQHPHGQGQPSDEPHEHRHEHVAIRHKHPHFPDIHHRHGH